MQRYFFDLSEPERLEHERMQFEVSDAGETPMFIVEVRLRSGAADRN